MLLQNIYWTRLINVIVQTYLTEKTICILWPEEFDFQLEDNPQSLNTSAFIIIDRLKVQNSSEADVVNYMTKRQQWEADGMNCDELVERLTLAIEKSHCEIFFAFQADILYFIEAFKNASRFSVWRSSRNKFIFGYLNSIKTTKRQAEIFLHDFFDEQAEILVIENSATSAEIFYLKTNTFVGPKSEKRRNLYLLDIFNASSLAFTKGVDLFPNKINNLQGREIVVAALHYRPTVVLEYGAEFETQDLAFEDTAAGKVRIDGTDLRTLIIFCEIYNCTLQINTAEADDWGFVFTNLTGFGTLGMIAKGTAEVAVGAMYSWVDIYLVLDMSMYLARDGITCVVPAPRRLTSWLLPLDPFSPTIWAAVCVYLIIEIFGLIMAHKSELILGAERHLWWPSVSFGYVTAFKLFVSQGGNEYVRTISVRVLLFACFFNDIIVTSIYGGGLASILTVPSFEEAADSLERLRSHHLIWAANSEAWAAGIREADDPIIMDILKNFRIYTDEQLTVMSLNERIGFPVERLPFGHYTIETFLSEAALRNMKIMLDDIYFQFTVTFTARSWPQLELYNNLLYMWHSSGFDKYWEWRVVAENMNMKLQKIVDASIYGLSNDDLGPVPLDMSNFAGMLIIWVLGITISILCFLGELLYKKITTIQA